MCQIGCALLPEQYAIFRPRSAGFIGYPAEWTVKPVAVAINNTTSCRSLTRTPVALTIKTCLVAIVKLAHFGFFFI